MAFVPLQQSTPQLSENDSERIPHLHSGDRLSRDEFERRYHASPNIKAELVEGVVYVALTTLSSTCENARRCVTLASNLRQINSCA